MGFRSFRHLFALLALLGAPLSAADEFAPITIYWHHKYSATIPNVTRVVVFEDTICRAEVVGDHIEFDGMARGDTPAFIWQGDKESTVVIHVVEKPETAPASSLQRQDDSKANGMLSSNVQDSNQNSRVQQLLVSNRLDWNEQSGPNRIRLQIQGETGTSLEATNRSYNIRTASVQYITQRAVLTLMDFNVDASGGIHSETTPAISSNTILLRGASLNARLFGGILTVFGGATLPPRFLYYGGTRDVVGASFQAAFSKRLRFSTTAAFTSVPILASNGLFTRASSFYTLTSLQALPTKSLQFEIVSGGSNRGGLIQGGFNYSTSTVTAFGNATYSSSSFPLNQLRLLPSGHVTASAGANAPISSKLSATVFLQDTTTQNGPLLNFAGTTQHVNPSVSYLATAKERFTVNYTFDRTTGTLVTNQKSTGNRVDAEWSSQFFPSLTQTLRVTRGALSDPFDSNSGDKLGIREATSWRPRRESRLRGLSFLFSYDRTNPSLAAKVIQQLALLSPALQQLYYLDPTGFLQEQNLPPGLLNLLSNLRPSSYAFELDGEFALSSRLHFAPTLSYLRTVDNVYARSFSPTFGFTLNYSATRNVSIHASLTNTFLFASALGNLQRTTVFSFGLNQSLHGMPHWIAGMSRPEGTILGRVFRDTDENGVFHAGKTGFSGLRIVLSNGAETYTDGEGRYKFEKLPPGEYTVHFPYSQFRKTVRLSTPADRTIDLRLLRSAESDFGVIDFSRVQGSVYNDYLGTDFREPDAPGIADVRVLLTSDKGKWEQICDTSGEFEFNNVDPGKYRLSIDPATIPDNYQSGISSGGEINVASAHTVTLDIPLVAMRSIQGSVVHVVKGREQPGPVAGVQVRVGDKSAFTSKEGNFLIRDLPSGDLEMAIVPMAPLPAGKKAPSGTIHLSRGPMEGRGIRIVISDDELLRYLTNGERIPVPAARAK